jgi:hypothetical protein
MSKRSLSAPNGVSRSSRVVDRFELEVNFPMFALVAGLEKPNTKHSMSLERDD